MKLRIHKNSIRFRLNRVDVDQIRRAGICGDTLWFGHGSQLTYVLDASSPCDSMRAEFLGDHIRVRIPRRLAQEWANSDQVSLAQDGDGTDEPSLLVEKDFQCLDREGRNPSEDQDCFPNPSGALQCSERS